MMVGIVRVNAKVKIDNSSQFLSTPVLLTEQGIIEPLLDYLISHDTDRSLSWKNRVVFACQLLLEYMSANQNLFQAPDLLFSHFVHRLQAGTINETGEDESELYWLPRRISNVNQLLSALNQFTDWLSIHRGSEPLNPLIEATNYQQQLNYAAWHKRNQHQFLGHLKSNKQSYLMKQTRKIRGKRDVIQIDSDAISFSENLFPKFLLCGLGNAKDSRVALRDQLILLLMHGAGVRESDALHLWVHDVLIDNMDENNALVRLYHPEDGRAPDNWKGRNKQHTRSAYLQELYGLKPRNRLVGTKRVGWKTKIVDHQDNYIHLHWFPAFYGVLFKKLWLRYLNCLLPIERNHPYAFISFSRNEMGQPLTLNAFNQGYKAGLVRIGLVSSKSQGRSPHAHRHAYGRRLTKAKLDPILIKKALHHSSLNSQLVYTTPGIQDVTDALNAIESINSTGEKTNAESENWSELLKEAFEDIDPEGLFSGKFPRFRVSQ